jgi:hypothetical protein
MLAAFFRLVSWTISPTETFVDFHRYTSPLWSNGQSSWLQIQGSRVRFLALPNFSEKQLVWNGIHVRITNELLEWKIAALGV